MAAVKTPCIGICSTTSLGDAVCRGCKRYSVEVINWNTYDDEAKTAVLARIEKLIGQILESKFSIFSIPHLQKGLDQAQIPYDPALSAHCWLHNLLKKNHQNIGRLEEYGVTVAPEYRELALAELCEQIEEEILVLCEAHFARYFEPRTAAALL